MEKSLKHVNTGVVHILCMGRVSGKFLCTDL